MKIANTRDFRRKATAYLREKESVLITRHGKITGLLYPIEDTDALPGDLQKGVSGIRAAAQADDIMALVLNELKKVGKINSLHLITALSEQPLVDKNDRYFFVCCDNRLLAAARKEKLKTVNPETITELMIEKL